MKPMFNHYKFCSHEKYDFRVIMQFQYMYIFIIMRKLFVESSIEYDNRLKIEKKDNLN